MSSSNISSGTAWLLQGMTRYNLKKPRNCTLGARDFSSDENQRFCAWSGPLFTPCLKVLKSTYLPDGVADGLHALAFIGESRDQRSKQPGNLSGERQVYKF